MDRNTRPVLFAFEPKMTSVFSMLQFAANGVPSFSTSTYPLGAVVSNSKGLCNVAGGYAGQSPAKLGAASAMAVFASQSITAAGGVTINGDLGLNPGSSVTGGPTVTGTSHVDDATAIAAQQSLIAAYANLTARPYTTDLTGINLGGLTLTPGVYKFASSAQLTGTLTLNAGGDPNAVFIFQIGTTLTTAASAVVALAGGAVPGNVFWAVGSSATYGASTTMQGVVLAQVSQTAGATSTFTGLLAALTGSLTLSGVNVYNVGAGNAGGPVGLYTLTFGSQFTPYKRLDAYPRLLTMTSMWDETVTGSAPAAPNVYLAANNISNANLASLTIQCGYGVGGAYVPTNPGVGEILRLGFQFSNSTAI